MSDMNSTVTGRRSRPIRTMVSTVATETTLTLTQVSPEIRKFLVNSFGLSNQVLSTVLIHMEAMRISEALEQFQELKEDHAHLNLTDAQWASFAVKALPSIAAVMATIQEVQTQKEVSDVTPN